MERHKRRHDSSDGCQRTSHFSTWASDLIASPVSLGTLKETRSAPGSVIREWTWLCDMALWRPACQRETGQTQDVERCRIMASESVKLHELYKWAVWQWFYSQTNRISFLQIAFMIIDVSKSSSTICLKPPFLCLELAVLCISYLLNSALLLPTLFSCNNLSGSADAKKILYSIVKEMNVMKVCCFLQHRAHFWIWSLPESLIKHFQNENTVPLLNQSLACAGRAGADVSEWTSG